MTAWPFEGAVVQTAFIREAKGIIPQGEAPAYFAGAAGAAAAAGAGAALPAVVGAGAGAVAAAAWGWEPGLIQQA